MTNSACVKKDSIGRDVLRFISGKILGAGLCLAAICAGPAGAASDDASTATTCDPAQFGGEADDNRPDTAALQAAIASCAGRGAVVIGPGVWLTGGLTLGSDMTLRLDAGAVLRLIPDMTLYPAIDAATGAANRSTHAALFAPFARNLRIEGPGLIDGSGPEFWDENFYELGIPRPTLPRPGPVIELADCENVVVKDLKMRNLPAYAIRFNRCRHSRVDNVHIENDPRSPNTDGIQIRDSSDIHIRRADIRTGDDAVVLKSGGRAVERIVVEDSYLESDDAAIKFGTGSRYGVKDSVFRRNVIDKSRYGIALFAIDGGTHERNVFEDTRITTGGRHTRTYPVFVDVDRREIDRAWGGVSGLTLRNLEIVSDGASLIAGNPNGLIENIRLQGITVSRADQPEDLERRSSKPRGSVMIGTQPESVDYSQRAAELVIAHARNVTIDALSLPPCGQLGKRQPMELIDVEFTGGSERPPADCR